MTSVYGIIWKSYCKKSRLRRFSAVNSTVRTLRQYDLNQTTTDGVSKDPRVSRFPPPSPFLSPANPISVSRFPPAAPFPSPGQAPRGSRCLPAAANSVPARRIHPKGSVRERKGGERESEPAKRDRGGLLANPSVSCYPLQDNRDEAGNAGNCEGRPGKDDKNDK